MSDVLALAHRLVSAVEGAAMSDRTAAIVGQQILLAMHTMRTCPEDQAENLALLACQMAERNH